MVSLLFLPVFGWCYLCCILNITLRKGYSVYMVRELLIMNTLNYSFDMQVFFFFFFVSFSVLFTGRSSKSSLSDKKTGVCGGGGGGGGGGGSGPSRKG